MLNDFNKKQRVTEYAPQGTGLVRLNVLLLRNSRVRYKITNQQGKETFGVLTDTKLIFCGYSCDNYAISSQN